VTPSTTSTIHVVINDRLTIVIRDLLREVGLRWIAAGGAISISRALTYDARK
jgi:hypothetical protein